MDKALLIHAGALGDFVLTLRLAAALRDHGMKHITFLGRGAHRELAVGSDCIDAYLDIDTGGFHCLFSRDCELPERARSRLCDFDLALNTLGASEDVTANLRRLGFERIIDIDPRPRLGWHGHITDQWLIDLADRGIDRDPGPPVLRFDCKSTSTRTGLAKRKSRGSAMIHPGSGARRKCWPLRRFMELADRLRQSGWQVSFLLGPAERELFSAEEKDVISKTACLIGECNLGEIVRRLNAADVFVGNDSGISHLAAALGGPVVAVFGPTDPRRWRPLGDRVAVAFDPPGWPSAATVANLVDFVHKKGAA